MNEYEQLFDSRVATHQRTWNKFAADPQNKVTLIAAAQRYRPCFVAFDRGFVDSQNQLVRSDGHEAQWDSERQAERKASKEAEIEASTIVDAAFQEYVMGLSQTQIAEVYYSDLTSEFARKYRICVRDLGYRLPSRAQPTRRAFVRRGVQE